MLNLHYQIKQIYRKTFLFDFKVFLFKTSHRILLEKNLFFLLKSFDLDYKKNTAVDFGCGVPRYKNYLKKIKWLFFDKYIKDKSVQFAVQNDIPIDSAELFLCIEVLEYLEFNEIDELINECNRIIGMDGYAIFSIPYLYPIFHKEKLRIANPNILEKKFSKFHKFEVVTFGNLFSILHDFLFDGIFKIIISILNVLKLKFLVNFTRAFFMLLIMPLKILAIISFKFNILDKKSGYFFVLRPMNP